MPNPIPTKAQHAVPLQVIFSCFDCDFTVMMVYMKMNDIKNNCSNYCRGLATTKELMNPEKGRARFRIRSTMPLLVIGKYHLDTNTFSFFVATIFVMNVCMKIIVVVCGRNSV